MVLMVDEVRRRKLFCPYCGTRGRLFEKYLLPFGTLVDKVENIKYFECEDCGCIFYDSSTVTLIMLVK